LRLGNPHRGFGAGSHRLVSAAELRPETRAAFDRYVRRAKWRIEAQVRGGDGILFATSAERRAVLRGGTVLTEAKTLGGP
jgi:hypothetical protein